MSNATPKIIYTYTDEAPALATHALRIVGAHTAMALVRDAARVGAGVAAEAGVVAAQPLLYELADAPAPRITTPGAATALFNRVVAYVDRLA